MEDLIEEMKKRESLYQHVPKFRKTVLSLIVFSLWFGAIGVSLVAMSIDLNYDLLIKVIEVGSFEYFRGIIILLHMIALVLIFFSIKKCFITITKVHNLMIEDLEMFATTLERIRSTARVLRVNPGQSVEEALSEMVEDMKNNDPKKGPDGNLLN